LKDGVTAREAYQDALTYIKDNNPDVEKNFVKNIGFGVSRGLWPDAALTSTYCKDWSGIP
jgi:hypothetical protein